MNVVNISDNIAWDGQHFFCRRCGKSGYKKMSQVRGHLAMCQGKAIQKGAIPQSQPVGNQLQVVTTASKANLEGSPTGWQPQLAEAVVPSYNQLYGNQLSGLSGLVGRIEKLEKKVENEVQHLLVQNNTSANDWFSTNKGVVIVVAVGVVLLVLLLRESSCKCEAPGGRTKANGIGSTLATRAVSKVVDKSLDRIFK